MKRALLLLALPMLLLAGCGGSGTAQTPPRIHYSASRFVGLFGSAQNPTVGEVLTTTNGTWTNSPTSYAYQWQRCTSSSPSSCSNINAATASSYTVASGDLGDMIDVVVTAFNAAGSASQTSAQTGVVTSGASCPNSNANTPGGPDPWGGCFPGPGNTGVPTGTTLTTVTPGSHETAAQAVAAGAPADNTGWADDGTFDIVLNSPNAVLDGISYGGVVYADSGNGGTVKNTQAECIHDNSSTGSMLVEDDSVVGGCGSTANAVYADTSPGPKLTVLRVNGQGGQHGVLCYHTCIVQDSYFHDNANSNPSVHANGFFTNGGQGDALIHNSWWCNPGLPAGVTECTADVSFNNTTNNGPEININEYHNLLVAIPSGAQATACLMPGPDVASGGFQVSGVTVDGYVFQKGSSGTCNGVNSGAIYGWYPATCSPDPCVWQHTQWDDGTALTESSNAHPTLSVSGPATGTHGVAISAGAISATVSGGSSATGTITYRVYGPLASPPDVCVGSDWSTPTSLGTATVSGNGSYSPSSGFTPASAGNYWLYAIYGGDGSNDAATSTCPPTAEIVVS